jgi:hypothetical protein
MKKLENLEKQIKTNQMHVQATRALEKELESILNDNQKQNEK